MAPNQLPAYVLMHLMGGDYEFEDLERYLENKLTSIPSAGGNLQVLISLVSMGLLDPQRFSRMRSLVAVLKGRVNGWKSETELFRAVLVSVNQLGQSRQHRSRVIAIILETLGVRLSVPGPFSTHAALITAVQEA